MEIPESAAPARVILSEAKELGGEGGEGPPEPLPSGSRGARGFPPLAAAVDVAALGFLAGLLLFHNLGASSLTGDETIYGQVERQAAFFGHWLPPRYAAAVFLAKPPLRLWAVALLFRFVGVSDWTARCLDAALGVATLGVVYLAGRALFGRRAGAVAALLLLGAHDLLFVHGLRQGVQESALLFTVSTALLAYLLAATDAAATAATDAAGAAGAADLGWTRGRAAVAAGLLAAASLLVKNAVGLLVLGVAWLHGVLYPDAGARRGLRRLLPAAPLRLAAVTAAVYLPWLAVAYRASGGTYFRTLYLDVVARATSGLDPGHLRQHVYLHQLRVDFGPALLLAGLLPLLLLPPRPGAGPDVHRADRERAVFLAVWAGALLAVMAPSASREEWYLYPAYPALALLVGCAADRLLARLAGAGEGRMGETAGATREIASPGGGGAARGPAAPSRSRRLRQALAAAGMAVVAVYLALGVVRAWRWELIIPPRIDADQLARQVEAAGPLDVCYDGLALREWNLYYLQPLHPRLARTPAEAAGCQVLVTADPERFVGSAFPAARIHEFQKFDPTEGDTYAVDLGGVIRVDEIRR